MVFNKQEVKKSLLGVFERFKKVDVIRLQVAIEEGRMDLTDYTGRCRCFLGHLFPDHSNHVYVVSIALEIKRELNDWSRFPFENIKAKIEDTHENNEQLAYARQVCIDYLASL